MSIFDYWEENDDPAAVDDEIPAGIKRHGSWGHAQIFTRDNPMVHFWARRASSVGDSLDRLIAIRNWEVRAGGQAVARNIDLLQRMQALPPLIQDMRPNETREEFETRMRPIKREGDEIMQIALDRAGCTRKANRGTALHRAWQTRMEGDPLPPTLDFTIAAGLEKIDDLLRGFDILDVEKFTAWEDTDPPSPETRCKSCGTLDIRAKLREGWLLPLPTGELEVPGRVRVIDLKSGDNKIMKAAYATQGIPYLFGDPYDWTLSPEQRKAGASPWLPWSDADRPARDYFLILHVPLDADHLPGSALWWVDAAKAMRFVRMAQTVRSIWNQVQAEQQEHFSSARVERDPDAAAEEAEAALTNAEQLCSEVEADPSPAVVPAGDATRSSVADLNDARIRHALRQAETTGQVLAVFEKWRDHGWTAAHATLAEQAYDRLSETPLMPTPK